MRSGGVCAPASWVLLRNDRLADLMRVVVRSGNGVQGTVQRNVFFALVAHGTVPYTLHCPCHYGADKRVFAPPETAQLANS